MSTGLVAVQALSPFFPIDDGMGWCDMTKSGKSELILDCLYAFRMFVRWTKCPAGWCTTLRLLVYLSVH